MRHGEVSRILVCGATLPPGKRAHAVSGDTGFGARGRGLLEYGALAETLNRVSTAAYQASASEADATNGSSDDGEGADGSGEAGAADGTAAGEGEEAVEGEFKEV